MDNQDRINKTTPNYPSRSLDDSGIAEADIGATDPVNTSGTGEAYEKTILAETDGSGGIAETDTVPDTDLGGGYDRDLTVDANTDNLPADAVGHPGIDEDTG